MRGRPLNIEWHEDAATLKHLYQQETDKEIRPRLHALWLARDGHCLCEVAALLGFHYHTVLRWAAWYRQGGLSEIHLHRNGGRQGRQAKLSAEQLAHLRSELDQAQLHTAAEIKQHIATQYQAEYRRTGVYSLLRRLHIHKKVPRPHSVKADDQAQEAWKKGG
jgi:transposase